MALKKRRLTKAELEARYRQGWVIGPGLDWRKFMPEGKAQAADHLQPEARPTSKPDPDNETNG